MSDVKNFGEDLRKAFENLFAMTLEDFQRVYEETICNAILEEEFSGEHKYVGGELIYEHVDEKNFTCEYKLFFQDAQGKFFRKTAKTDNISTKPLSTDMREKISSEKILKFEIPEPSDEAREEYKRQHSAPQ